MKSVLVAFLSAAVLLAQAGGLANASSTAAAKSCCGKSCPAPKKACCKPSVPRAAVTAAAVPAPAVWAPLPAAAPVPPVSFVRVVLATACGPPGRSVDLRSGRSPPSLLG